MAPMTSTRLYTNAGVRALDAHAIETQGVSGATLMQRAAAAAVDVLRWRWPDAASISVACGPGNNGGDGFVLAVLAHQAGLNVHVCALTDTSTGDAADARQQCIDAGIEIRSSADASCADGDVIVDALFGSGLSRPLEGQAAALVAAINDSGKPILALDVPSGISGDTGMAAGAVIHAQATTCFVAFKRGLFTGHAVDACGALSLHTLDLPDASGDGTGPDAEVLAPIALAPRARDSHKGDYGHVLVVGGDHGFGGAVRLAGEAALRSGVGLTSVATRQSHVAGMLAARPELMVRAVGSSDELPPLVQPANIVLAGPGLGQDTWGRDLWQAIMRIATPLVLDADGLNLLANEPRAFAERPTVLTPHPGEAARLLETATATVQTDRFAAARQLATRYAAVVVLKGAGSLVAAPDGRVGVCRHGNPGLAGGGSGDVLGGVIAALMAQGLAPWRAATLGVDLHARAGDMAARDGQRGLLASDLFVPLRRLVDGAEK